MPEPFRPDTVSASMPMLHAIFEAGLAERPCTIWTAVGWKTYIPPPSEAPSIVCPNCGARSYHLMDIERRYCGRCHRYHEDMR